MTRIYLVRHGKSALRGEEHERGLEPEGLEHAAYIAERLGEVAPSIDAIYCSPYRRALLTMQPLAELLGLEVRVMDGFREKELSSDPVTDKRAAHAKMWLDFDHRLPGGESSREAQDRAIASLEQVRDANPGRTVAIGSHGTLIALMLNAHWPQFGYEGWAAMTMPDIFRLDFAQGRPPHVEHIACPGVQGFTIPR